MLNYFFYYCLLYILGLVCEYSIGSSNHGYATQSILAFESEEARRNYWLFPHQNSPQETRKADYGILTAFGDVDVSVGQGG